MDAPICVAGLLALLDGIRQALERGETDRIGALFGEYRDNLEAFIAIPAAAVSHYDDLNRLLQAHLRMQDILGAARGMIADDCRAFRRSGRAVTIPAPVPRR